jgi:hypothetical protein
MFTDEEAGELLKYHKDKVIHFKPKTSLTVDTSLDIVIGSCKTLSYPEFDISTSLNENAEVNTTHLFADLFNLFGKVCILLGCSIN